jgi:hypothetical protein
MDSKNRAGGLAGASFTLINTLQSPIQYRKLQSIHVGCCGNEKLGRNYLREQEDDKTLLQIGNSD